MNKPSERIVVFVTPAQKLAIASTAERLGISVSELMRRAVLSFGATSEQVKAASIVDRLNAPREPDALNAALQRVAAASKRTNARNNAASNPPASLRRPAAAQDDAHTDAGTHSSVHSGSGAQARARADERSETDEAAEAARADLADHQHTSSLDDTLAIAHHTDSEDTDEDAVARVTAAWRAHAGRDRNDAASSGTVPPSPAAPPARRVKPPVLSDDSEDDSSPDPTAEGGRFA
jgi:hypothetical protein